MRDTPPATRAFRLRSLMLPVYAPTLLFGAGVGMIIPVLPLFAAELGAGLALVGVIVSMRGVGTMLSDVPSGVAVTRSGARVVVLLGMGLTVAVAITSAFATDALVLLVLVLLNGVAWSMWSVARLIYVRDVVPLEFRGRAVSRIGGVNRLGMLVGPMIGGLVGSRFGLAETFFAQALVTAAALVLVATRFRDPATVSERAGGAPPAAGVLLTLIEQRRPLLTAGVAAITLTLVRDGRLILFPLWGQSIGLNVAQIGLVFGAAAVLDTALFYPAGVVMDRWGRKWTLVPSLLLLSASLLLVPFTHSFSALLIVGLLSGLGNGVGSGVVMTLGADLAPRSGSGHFLGLWRLVTDVGAAGAPILVGGLAAALTLGVAASAAAGAGVAGAALMLLTVPETLHRRR